jgi:ABC-type multidrug transport system fused ATPase/permease subunit
MNVGNLLGGGILVIVLSCVIFLAVLFGILPLPYIISAAVLKIPNRNYWKAFGSAILGGLAGAATSVVVVLIMAAITGSLSSLSLRSNSSSGLLPLMGGAMIFGWLLGWGGSIVVEMAITGALYQVGFGKGALIWLLAAVFGFLLGVVITLIMFVISAAAIGNIYNQFRNAIQGTGLQYYIPSFLSVM